MAGLSVFCPGLRLACCFARRNQLLNFGQAGTIRVLTKQFFPRGGSAVYIHFALPLHHAHVSGTHKTEPVQIAFPAVFHRNHFQDVVLLRRGSQHGSREELLP